jgi:peptidoglycan/LPS O-acetylase OafA/YrhL
MLLKPAGPGLYRFALALLVFLNHTSSVDLGFAAVLIFFTLSGYWIFEMWTERYSRARGPYTTFIISRVWRLWPAFILASAIAWPLAWWSSNIPAKTTWLYQIVPSFLILGYGLDWQPNVPAWSLDIEMQFYLIAPLLIALMARWATGTLIACAVVSAAAVALGAGWSVAYYIVFFAIGMVAANVEWRPSPRLAWLALALTSVVVVLWMISPLRSGLIDTDQYSAPRGYREVAQFVLALMMIPWTIYTASQRATRTDRALGDLSYLVYLFHEPLYEALNFATASHLGRVLMKLGILGLVLLVSCIVWLGVDRPSNRLRAKWVNGRIRAGYPDSGASVGNEGHAPANRSFDFREPQAP